MRQRPHDVRRPSVAALVAVAVLVLGVTAACSGDQAEPSPEPGPTTPAKTTELTFGVWGAEEEVAAYQSLVDDYNAERDGVEIEMVTWPSHEAFRQTLTGDPAEVPDIYLVSRGDLSVLREGDLNQPLLELLDERGVNYADDYARDALLAFSSDNELQCMPYGISPTVIYYNTALIDFERMRQQGRLVPEDPEGTHEEWTLEEFTAAAEFATRPRKGTRGVHIDSTLRGLAPFIYSGGGDLFDDEDEPTSLALSEDSSREALTRTLEVLRNAAVTLTEEQLREASSVEWFKRGKLGMVAGTRELTPELRDVAGLDFDVMPMPVLEDAATVGDITGLCLASDAASTARAADFLVHVVSPESVARVAQAGYLSPASLPVALSEEFLQPTLAPLHAGVFSASIRDMQVPPLLDDWNALEAAVADNLDLLLTSTVPDVEGLTTQIDEDSRAVLDPPEPSTSPSPSSSPTD